MGLEYRAIGVGGTCITILGVVDFCVVEQHRGKGVGSSMLTYLDHYAQNKPVDFFILISEIGTIYSKNGCLLYTSPSPRDRTRSRMPSSA